VSRKASLVGSILCLSLLIGGSLCAAGFSVPDLANWPKPGPPDVFSREDLYGYLDGGAELYLEYGFQELTVQRYARSGRELTLETYRFADAEGALGLYLSRAGREIQVDGVQARSTGDRRQFSAVKGDFYVQVNNFKGEAALAPDMVRLMNAALAGLLQGAPVPADPLPLESRVQGSFRILRGPLALQSFCTLGEGDILRFGGRLTGYAADYKTGSGSHTLIVVPYPDEKSATEAFQGLVENLDPALKTLSRSERQLVYQDFQDRFGEAALSKNEIRIRIGLAERP